MLAAILLCGSMALLSCSDSNDNKGDTTSEPTPSVELADYTLFIYGHAGGDMDEYIENIRDSEFPTRGNRFSYVWEMPFLRVGSAHAS